jgi:dolichol-phosphate mannosyltransferase
VTGLVALLALAQLALAVRVVVRIIATAGGARIAVSDASSPERISIVVPVLNEEARLGRCLEGAVAQPAEVAEILVVDGGSRDATRAVVERYAARDPRVRWVDASPVPASWTGKAWGLASGLRASAKSDWILCLDADVQPPEGLARALLAHAAAVGVGAFSAATVQRLAGAAQGLVHPALLTTLVTRFGSPGHATREVSRVQANGQCFLARRALLAETGAFDAARDSLCEDVTIARRIAEAGHPVGFYESALPIPVSMYADAAEAWRNWPRSLPMRDRYFGAREALGLVEVAGVQALPLPLLALFAALGASPWLVNLELALVAVRIGMLGGMARAYADRPFSYWLSPLADLPAALRLVRCALQRRHAWRGRVYVRGSDGGFQLDGGTTSMRPGFGPDGGPR